MGRGRGDIFGTAGTKIFILFRFFFCDSGSSFFFFLRYSVSQHGMWISLFRVHFTQGDYFVPLICIPQLKEKISLSVFPFLKEQIFFFLCIPLAHKED